MLENDGRRRVVIERVEPQIDCGRFAIKRVVGERVVVEAAVFGDGHDHVACQVVWCRDGGEERSERMAALGNDRFRGEFVVDQIGQYRYTVEGWIDRFQTWRNDLEKRIGAGQDLEIPLQIGANLIEEAAARAFGKDTTLLREAADKIRAAKDVASVRSLVLSQHVLQLMQRHGESLHISRYEKELTAIVDCRKARFSAWYEVFPRSCAPEPRHHGTLRDCQELLPYVASMGFDVVYLPPVHPIGHTFRKGKNNSPIANPDDVGSPWAIGSEDGGHKSIHHQLGSLQDFRDFVIEAKKLNLDVALDIAFQCTPDHPYVREHPDWFRKRPDGSIQYAENPPKKYQDIYPLDFECADWRNLWAEMKSVFDFWIEQGIRLFRVDNPHTKPFAFWEWVIGEIKRRHPETVFLAEAFTRPHVMYRLAKLGFSQSYTYFAWRNTKQELTDYFTELTQTEVREYFRPSLWTNTPDILTGFLQSGGRPAFMVRFILAATLGANYGIYGPAFELCEDAPLQPGSEEYLNSEKYELKHRDLNVSKSLRELITTVNNTRKQNEALQSDGGLRFHATDNPMLICYSKTTADFSDTIVVVVNLDPSYRQTGWVDLNLRSLGLETGQPYQVRDLLGGGLYVWHGSRNYVELTPEVLPAHILKVRR